MYNLERYTLVSDLFKFNYFNAKFVPMVTEKFAPFTAAGCRALIILFYCLHDYYKLPTALKFMYASLSFRDSWYFKFYC